MIDVIVPVYNCEKYLNRCIESIINQTYVDWKLYLIDDGSTDSSREICDKYARRDYRITTMHKENEGVSAARNEGLKLCDQEIVVFVDADDWIEITCFEEIIKNWNDETELVFFDYNEVDEQGEKKHCSFYEESFVSKVDNKQLRTTILETLYGKKTDGQLNFKHTIAVPWGKAYKRDVIYKWNIEFYTDIFFNEDLLFNLQFINRIDNIKYINGHYYNYNINIQSLSNTLSRRHIDELIYNFSKCNEYVEFITCEECAKLKRYYYFKNYKILLWNLSKEVIDKANIKEILNSACKDFCFSIKELDFGNYFIYLLAKSRGHKLIHALFELKKSIN